MPGLDQGLNQAKQFVSGLTTKQRLMIIGAAVVTVAVLVVFVNLIGTPDYKALVSGMEANDTQALTAKLASKNISFQISPDGKTVSVPADKLDSARMEIASEGMPGSGRMGFELFDKLNWGQTEFDQKVNYQRALEGELERSIQTLSEVESVRVHLVMPTESVFIDRDRGAKASVILKLRTGRLAPDTQAGIARLVSGAVDKLSPDDVTVIDAESGRPLGPKGHGAISGAGDLEETLSARLLKTLEPVVGADGIRASVNVDYDSATAEENTETYDPKSAVAVTAQKSEEQVGGIFSGGVPGTTSNVPGSNGGAKPATEGGSDGTQMSKSESTSYAVNRVVRHVTQPAGRIRRISAALVVDDATETVQENGKPKVNRRKRTAEELKQIEELAKAAIGLDPTRGDTVTVQSFSFEHAPVEALVKPAITERVRVTLNDWSSTLRYGALILLFLLVYLLLLRPMKKQVIATFKQLPESLTAKVQLPESEDLNALGPEQQRALLLKKQIAEKVRTEPVAASKLIQGWLHEGKA